jgi:polyhydroxyalkanoate synthase
MLVVRLPLTAISLALALLLPSMARADGLAPGLYRESLPTSDGVRATIYRYVPEPGLQTRPAILLLPDVGLTRRSYDFRGRGLARYLARYGAEVLVLEYRGAGLSQAPAHGFSFENLLDLDVEAALSRASEGHERIYLAGHGLGGTLAFLAAARHPEKIAGVIGLQAAATMEIPNEPIAALLAKNEMRPDAWLDLAAATEAPLFGEASWFDVLLANGGGISSGERRSARLALLSTVPARLVADVVRFMGERRIAVGGAEVRTLVAGWRGRSLLFVAPRDNWIHPEAALPLIEWLDPRATQTRALSPIEGAGTDYGHLGLLLGPEAERDVWRHVLEFVDEVAR